MKLKKAYGVLIMLSFICSSNALAKEALITVTCPLPEEVEVSLQNGSWAKYRYQAQASVHFAGMSNQLAMSGEGNTEAVYRFEAATWTDRTFLCVYNHSHDAVVLFESQLNRQVKRCYFAEPYSSECIADIASRCVLTCDLGRDED